MAIARKLKKILKDQFPPPDKVKIRNGDKVIAIVTSKRFQQIDTMQRQDLFHDILTKKLTDKERREVLMIVGVTPEEEIFHSVGMEE